jgi:plastocyanin
MKSSYILAGIVLILLIGGIVWFNASQKSNKANTATPSTGSPTESIDTTTTASEKTAAVQFTDQGFSPATLTVVSGTTVTFTNQSSTTVWPASDPHPSHTGLPGFDANKGLAKGESYSFTFTKTGKFG